MDRIDISEWRRLKKERYEREKIKNSRPGESDPAYKGLILGYDIHNCQSLIELNLIYENSLCLPDGKSKTFLHKTIERRGEKLLKYFYSKKLEELFVDSNNSNNFAESN